jgi:hypothetical protein
MAVNTLELSINPPSIFPTDTVGWCLIIINILLCIIDIIIFFVEFVFISTRNLKASLNVYDLMYFTLTKWSRRIRWAGHVARMGRRGMHI